MFDEHCSYTKIIIFKFEVGFVSMWILLEYIKIKLMSDYIHKL